MENNGIVRKDPGHYKMETNNVRKSRSFRVHKHHRIGTHDVKKTLGLRFHKEIQTCAKVVDLHSIVSFGLYSMLWGFGVK